MTDDPPERSPAPPDGQDAGDAGPPEGVSTAPDAETPPDSDEQAGDARREATGEGGDGPPEDVTEYTTDVRTLDPTVRWLWIGRSLVYAAVAGGLVVGAGAVAAPEFAWVGGVVALLVAVLGTVHALLLYRSWEYRIREDSVYLDRGVITRVQTVVPYVRVQHIDTSRGPIERAIGLSSLVIYTAGSRGADVTVPGLVPAEAADLQTRLKVLAIESEGEDAV
jgi:membrane protein YdbS with pleckstrin-like domain